ncbi:30S ribosomal subunit protein S4 [Candidatus Hodgkinia cicadicola]|uniref:Small ribosomal subunit protein uS4 n=1 Tax=Candidatus Hodgkinia cicadicola TaxID=573658 RepID=A0ABX4MHA0_9HYPH|nr:30S ribosomal subunit protein S4 [Candidatus Hodgkinia cicadicola]
MNRRKRPKFKFDRRIGENIWASRRSSFNKREYGPGQHGNKLKKKQTDYGIRLLAKQKMKVYYSNLTESKFKKVYLKALQLKGNVALNIVRLLEMRLDVLVHRAGLAPSFRAARQLINHGYILVNDKKVNICSYECRIGDSFRVHPQYINSELIKKNVLSFELNVPKHIECTYRYLTFKLLEVPEYTKNTYPVRMSPESVVEYYSGRF